MDLPSCELKRAGDENDQSGADRNGASHSRDFHLKVCQRKPQRKDSESGQGPHEEIAETGQPGQLASIRFACAFFDRLTITVQHRRQ